MTFHVGFNGLGMPSVSYVQMTGLVRQVFEENGLSSLSLNCSYAPGGICYSTENCTVLQPLFTNYQFNVTFGAQPEYMIQIPLTAVMRDAKEDLDLIHQCEFLVINLGPSQVEYS
jgi:hypothetical protein